MAVAWRVGAWANLSWVGMNAGPPNAWRGASTPVPAASSGVSHARQPVIRLSDISPDSRQSTADFLKAQLGLDEKYAQTPQTESQPKSARKNRAALERERLAELAMRNSAIEAENEVRTIRNNNILILMMMAE